MKKKLLLLAVLVGLSLVLISFLTKKSDSAEKTSRATSVQVMDVVRKDVPIYIDSFGSFDPDKDVDIKPRTSGQVQKISFKGRSFINKGQPLFELGSRSSKAKLLNDEASLEKALADLKLKEMTLNRLAKPASTGAISFLDYESNKNDVLVAKAEVKKIQADITIDKINLEHCFINAPISGIIGDPKISEGCIVSADSTVMATIKNIDPLYVGFPVSEKDIPRIRKALVELGRLKVIVCVDEKTNSSSIKQTEYEAYIDALNNAANSAAGTISLSATLPNKEKILLPGQFGKVKLLVENRKDALLIHQSAIKLGPDGQYVFIVGKDSKAELVAVTVSQEYGDYYVLENGKLQAGDKLIVSGLLDLSPGDSVTVQN